MKFKLKKISGDASFRQFYRLKAGRKKTIIVKSNKEKFRNLITYSIINRFLQKRGILTPKLFNEFFKNGMMEIEDFGDISLGKYLKKKRNKYHFYKKIVELLLKIQKIKAKSLIGSYKNHNIYLDLYNRKNLHKESDLFFDWYLPGVIGQKKTKEYKFLIRRELDIIYKKLYFKNTYLVHRDFHVSNLMFFKNKIGLIDTQDAIIGNPAYDLVSLIDDVRIETSVSLKKEIFNYYLSKTSKVFKKEKNNFTNDFNILSIQRNLKILGIFYRLFKRDKKNQYLKFIPYTWKLIELRIKNSMFDNLELLLNKAVNKKLRKKNLLK